MKAWRGALLAGVVAALVAAGSQAQWESAHQPPSNLLSPTSVTRAPAPGVSAAPASYPAGQRYVLAVGDGEALDVYTGSFTVTLPVVAAAGQHTLSGSLRYQACDRAACYPPRTLPVDLLFTAK